MRTILTLCCLLILVFHCNAQNTLTEYQYWFDADFTTAQSGIMTGNEFTGSIATGTLSVGMHTFHVRTKQANGTWSSVVSQQFLKPNALVEYEYWFDDAFATRVSINVSNVSMMNINTLANATALGIGFHQLHYRAKSQDGTWSSIITQSFLKPTLIDGYEFWFDGDYNNKVSQSLAAPVKTLIVNDLLSVNALAGSHHTIHFRTHQQDGSWSVVSEQEFHTQNRIVAYEYWFNSNYSGKIVQAVSPTPIYDLHPQLDASGSPLGSNTIYLRFKDENGKWSPTLSDGFCHNTGDSSIHLKLFLQGYYAGSGQMGSVLLNQGAGMNGLTTDSIDVELHAPLAPYGLVASTRAELKTDGSAKVDFPFTYIGSYYLAVKHRNTLQTWTAYPIFRGECPLEYDFTVNSSSAYGSNQVEVEPNRWAFYTGDINQDENIDLLDISFLENDINAFQFGYFSTDLNGDGNVDLLDGPLLEGNVNGFIYSVHP